MEVHNVIYVIPNPLPLLCCHGSLKNPSKPSSTEAQWTSHLRQVEKQVVVWQGGVWTQGLRQKGQFWRSLHLVPTSCVDLPPPPLPPQSDPHLQWFNPSDTLWKEVSSQNESFSWSIFHLPTYKLNLFLSLCSSDPVNMWTINNTKGSRHGITLISFHR